MITIVDKGLSIMSSIDFYINVKSLLIHLSIFLKFFLFRNSFLVFLPAIKGRSLQFSGEVSPSSSSSTAALVTSVEYTFLALIDGQTGNSKHLLTWHLLLPHLRHRYSFLRTFISSLDIHLTRLP
jgi:hypothetical protein